MKRYLFLMLVILPVFVFSQRAQPISNLEVKNRAYIGNKLGVGVVSPTERVEINGAVKVGAASAAQAGTIQWDGATFMGYNGSAWIQLDNVVPEPYPVWFDTASSYLDMKEYDISNADSVQINEGIRISRTGQEGGSDSQSASPTIFETSAINGGTVGWSNLEELSASEAVYAILDSIPAGDGRSMGITCVGFGFTIPDDATIDSIVIQVEAHSADTSTGVSNVGWIILKAGSLVVYLADSTDISPSDSLTESDVVYSGYPVVGETPLPLWGTGWTASDINASNFGCIIDFYDTQDSIFVDNVSMVVYYTVPTIVGRSTVFTADGSITTNQFTFLSSDADSNYTILATDKIILRDTILSLDGAGDTLFLPDVLQTDGRIIEILPGVRSNTELFLVPEDGVIYYDATLKTHLSAAADGNQNGWKIFWTGLYWFAIAYF